MGDGERRALGFARSLAVMARLADCFTLRRWNWRICESNVSLPPAPTIAYYFIIGERETVCTSETRRLMPCGDQSWPISSSTSSTISIRPSPPLGP